MIELPLKDRATAGQALANELASRGYESDLLVLALPRGGVPVAYELARARHAELDLMLVRKLGSPGNEELAMGAIASGGIRVLNQEVISVLSISNASIERVVARESAELARREHAYRGNRPRPRIAGQRVVLVDDGVATGASMRAAIQALRQQGPESVIAAVPVGPAETIDLLRDKADAVICLATPEFFMAIGQWYEDFRQVSDHEVQRLLQQAWSREPV